MHRFALPVFVFAALALPALAGQVPIPRQKPKVPGSESISIIPIPRQKPAPPQAVPPPATPPAGDSSWPKADIEAERAECSRLLGGLDLTWTWADPIGGPGGCGAPAPITVTRVAGAKLSPPGTFRCGMALALHGWMATSVQPAARRALKQPVTAIANASSYVCRNRNGLAGGKVSEHGKANALDIASFTVGGENLPIAADKNGLLNAIGLSPRAEFLKQVRKEACASFTTVLGPGSDPYHGDHFHVDALQRKNGFRICQ